MKTYKIIIIIIVLLLLAASFYAGTRCGRARAITKETSFNAITTVATLAYLRTGDTNKALELLEHLLDGNTLTVGTWINSPLAKSNKEQMLTALDRIALYREKYPRAPLEMLDIDSLEVPDSVRNELLKQNELNEKMNADIERILSDANNSLKKSEE